MTSENTPIVNRLRSRLGSTDFSQKETVEPKNRKMGNEKKGKNEKSEGDNMSYSKLLEHIQMMQEKTEQTMSNTFTKSLVASKHEIKSNMRKMISSLTSTVDELKQDLLSMKTTFEGKLGVLEKDVNGFKNRMSDLENDVKKVAQAGNDEKSETRSKIKMMEDEMGDQKRKHLKEVNSLKMEIESLRAEYKEIAQVQ